MIEVIVKDILIAIIYSSLYCYTLLVGITISLIGSIEFVLVIIDTQNTSGTHWIDGTRPIGHNGAIG